MITAEEARALLDESIVDQVARDAYTNSLDLATKGGGPYDDLPERAKERTRVMVRDVLTAYLQTEEVARKLDQVTDLFERWAAEEDEHRRDKQYGIAEGLKIASDDLRRVIHGGK